MANTPKNISFPHPRLLPHQAEALGYKVTFVRGDDGTVQSMETSSGYRITYGAPSYASAY